MKKPNSKSLVYYSYVSSCAEAPRVPGKKSFLDFTSNHQGYQDISEKSVEAKTTFSMYKFEYNHVEAKSYLMLPKNRYLISSPRPQIKVTVISQVEFGDPELTYSIY